MTELLRALSWLALGGGALLFVAGTSGLLRFPNFYARLHAVTKADTAGLGLIVLGLSLRAHSWQSVAMMVLIWILLMASGATTCQLLARYARSANGDMAPTPPARGAGLEASSSARPAANEATTVHAVKEQP